MISKSKVESHSLKMTNKVLYNPDFYDLLNCWILDHSKGNVRLSSYYTYSDFCSTFSINIMGISETTKFIEKPTPNGFVFVGIYRTMDGITVSLCNRTEELEIIEDKD